MERENQKPYVSILINHDRALNLDGGGSSTIAIQTPQGIELLNAPIQNHLPMNERPVTNHLGFYFPQTPQPTP